MRCRPTQQPKVQRWPPSPPTEARRAVFVQQAVLCKRSASPFGISNAVRNTWLILRCYGCAILAPCQQVWPWADENWRRRRSDDGDRRVPATAARGEQSMRPLHVRAHLGAELLVGGERMPVFVWTIDHPAGLVLVDTGMIDSRREVDDMSPTRTRRTSPRRRQRHQHPPAFRPLRR